MTIDQRELDDLRDRLAEFGRDGRKVDDHAMEAIEHLLKGDLQGACDLVSVASYKIQHQQTEVQGLIDAFDRLGIRPREGRN